ncbi:MAG: cob(I)yrinic acid a,c-diamide adenosyltransferase [Elusimicrobia bacterium]|nr:cob(I)yrinic acid a,c-diamide adenosyltransferase [Elusimicrobiota bacterium]
MTKIYTKTGDRGQTGLLTGVRVSKGGLRVSAYGEVDELNAWLGILTSQVPLGEPWEDVRQRLQGIQGELFELGAELADPAGTSRKGAALSPQAGPQRHVEPALPDRSRVPQATERLEREMDEYSEKLPPLKNFILPGGGSVGASFHHARCVCRRAERALVRLWEAEEVSPEALRYVNRLSDWLFVVARWVNQLQQKKEEIWRSSVEPK